MRNVQIHGQVNSFFRCLRLCIGFDIHISMISNVVPTFQVGLINHRPYFLPADTSKPKKTIATTKCWELGRVYFSFVSYFQIPNCQQLYHEPRTKQSYQEIPGLAAIVEVGVNYTVKLPVEPMLFRLLRVGKLIRAIRMASWDERVGWTFGVEGLRCGLDNFFEEPLANQVFNSFQKTMTSHVPTFSNRFQSGWEGVGDR